MTATDHAPVYYRAGGVLALTFVFYAVVLAGVGGMLYGIYAACFSLLLVKPLAFAPLPDYPHERRLTRNRVRSLCTQLGIPAEDFGLETEEPG